MVEEKKEVIVVNRDNLGLLRTPEAQERIRAVRERTEKMLRIIKEMEKRKFRPVFFKIAMA